MPDRPLTPHELHQKAISVLDQIARLESRVDAGVVPPVSEIDVVARAAADLRRRIEETGREQPDSGAVALGHLSAARHRVIDALELVGRLATRIEDHRTQASSARRPDAGPAPGP